MQVELNFPAAVDQFLAPEIFDDATLDLVGDAFVSVRGQTMTIYLRRRATVVAEDVLVLKDGQTKLRDSISGTAFVNSVDDVVVETCSACLTPTVYVNYPGRISAGCSSSAPPKATFDGSLTVDHTGRQLACAWSVGKDGDEDSCFRDSDSSSDYSSCATLKNKLETERYLVQSLPFWLIVFF